MEIFKDYEKVVLGLLVSEVLSSDQLVSIIRNSELVGCEYTGSGYFLEISYPDLSQERIVCDKPIVIGAADGITCGFLVFIENGKLLLECHTWGEINVPKEFRDKNVQVKPINIEERDFVDLKSLF